MNEITPITSAPASTSLLDYPQRIALVFRILLNCGFFGASLPLVQAMVVRMRIPKRIIEDALAILQEEGSVELRDGQYRRVYRVQQGQQKTVRQRIAVLTDRSIFTHYYEVYQDYLMGMAEVFDVAGFDLLFSHEAVGVEGKLIAIEEMSQSGTRGVAFMGACEPEVRSILRAKGIPTVLCGNSTIEQRDFGCVCSDNIFGIKNLVHHLLRIGHKQIGFYTTSALSHDGYHHRFIGYRDAMYEAGLPTNEKMLQTEHHTASSSNKAAGVFTRMPVKERPTAIVCACDRDAFELISELEKSGIKVPRDVSVAGFENSFFNIFSQTELTTVDIFPREMGRIAAGFLINEVKEPQLPARIILPSRLIERGSVQPLGGTLEKDVLSGAVKTARIF